MQTGHFAKLILRPEYPRCPTGVAFRRLQYMARATPVVHAEARTPGMHTSVTPHVDHVLQGR